MLCAIPVGVLVGLPALRTRGVNLAIATLGLALLIERVVLGNADYTGGFAGTVVKPPSLFGIDLDPITHPGRYATFCMVMFTIAALVVANLRRGRAGRRLVAVRTNERAAASLGIGVIGAKLYAFGLSAAIAGLGGILLAFRTRSVLFAQFNVFASIQVVVQTVLGGIGFIGGALFSGLIAIGGSLTFAIQAWLGDGRPDDHPRDRHPPDSQPDPVPRRCRRAARGNRPSRADVPAPARARARSPGAAVAARSPASRSRPRRCASKASG